MGKKEGESRGPTVMERAGKGEIREEKGEKRREGE